MINISDNRYFFTKIKYFIFKTKRGWISTPLQSIIVRWMSLFIHRRWEKKKKKEQDISRNVRLVRKENEGNLPWDAATFA